MWLTGRSTPSPAGRVTSSRSTSCGITWTREVGRLAAPFAVGESVYAALATGSGRAVAAFDPADRTTRWQRAGDPVGVDGHGVSLVRDGASYALTEGGDPVGGAVLDGPGDAVSLTVRFAGRDDAPVR